jgi:hypothetical protein
VIAENTRKQGDISDYFLIIDKVYPCFVRLYRGFSEPNTGLIIAWKRIMKANLNPAREVWDGHSRMQWMAQWKSRCREAWRLRAKVVF